MAPRIGGEFYNFNHNSERWPCVRRLQSSVEPLPVKWSSSLSVCSGEADIHDARNETPRDGLTVTPSSKTPSVGLSMVMNTNEGVGWASTASSSKRVDRDLMSLQPMSVKIFLRDSKRGGIEQVCVLVEDQ